MIASSEAILMLQSQESSPEISDELLVRQARAGDLSAMDQLVRRWQIPLVRFLERRIGSRADAEDLFQETFIRIQRHLAEFDDRRRFKTWIFTIAWRLAANYLRDRKRTCDPEVMHLVADAADGPLEHAQQRELHVNLWQVARRVLSTEQYNVLWLFHVEQFPPREIARVTGKSWVAIKTALHRARKSLKVHLETFERKP